MSWATDQLMKFLSTATLSALHTVWGLLSSTVLVSPDVTQLPQLATITGRSLLVVNTCFVLAIIAAGALLMTDSGSVQARYSVGELAPRLVVGFVAANFAVPLCGQLIGFANAFTQALTGVGIDSAGTFRHLERIVGASINSPQNTVLALVLGVCIAVLAVQLMIGWIVRVGVLIALVGVAPIALACHALPMTDGAARLWWRGMGACLGTVTVQAFTLQVTLAVLLDPAANRPALPASDGLGGVTDVNHTFNALVVICLLWTTVKIPGLLRRFALAGGGGGSRAGALVRVLALRQVMRLVPGSRSVQAAAQVARPQPAPHTGPSWWA